MTDNDEWLYDIDDDGLLVKSFALLFVFVILVKSFDQI